ncbi:unnamed protein product [Angiostrongylus costaricensis]|uniref:UBX domain-containing protein 4 n=1 Tax=Angiostrongylus costaricensis TaxID=334426 RepID=A0A0R3PYS7_ANGCS|nr:unnamed protein product [Angiostrongylus costaricensis]
MKWFAGSVSTAVQVSRKNNALFIVFIESENAKGEKMRELWDKVNPTPVLPASYIIDNLGKPIEVITLLKDLSFDEFFTKVVNSVKIFSASTKSSQKNEGSSQAVASSSLDKAPLASNSTSPSSSAGMSLEEKTKRAKLLLEQKSAIEKARKQEEEKKRELERINTGKLLQEAQKKRREQELIEAAAQRRRDKIEAERERERLKAQIKADREEREFRERRGIPVADKTPLAETTMPKLEPVASDRCRVQVRLPNGENIVEEFLSSDFLCTLKESIEQDGRVSGSFSLAQMFPRKVFTDDELQKSFVDLCLMPTCTLLVIQSPNKTSHRLISATPLVGIFSLFSLVVIAPLQSIYSIVAGWLGWRRGEILLLCRLENNRSCLAHILSNTVVIKDVLGNGSTSRTHPRQTQNDAVKIQREPRAEGATIQRIEEDSTEDYELLVEGLKTCAEFASVAQARRTNRISITTKGLLENGRKLEILLEHV